MFNIWFYKGSILGSNMRLLYLSVNWNAGRLKFTWWQFVTFSYLKYSFSHHLYVWKDPLFKTLLQPSLLELVIKMSWVNVPVRNVFCLFLSFSILTHFSGLILEQEKWVGDCSNAQLGGFAAAGFPHLVFYCYHQSAQGGGGRGDINFQQKI